MAFQEFLHGCFIVTETIGFTNHVQFSGPFAAERSGAVRAAFPTAVFRDLYLVLEGFAEVFQGVTFGFLLMFIVLAMSSIVAVEVIHPLLAEKRRLCGCDRCERAFLSVMGCMVTILSAVL